MGQQKKLSGIPLVTALIVLVCVFVFGCAEVSPVGSEAQPKTLTVTADPLEVAVGEDGQFQTLNEALAYCSGFYPAYQQSGCGITIRILEGTVLREQIVCSAIDLSYITITAEQSESYPYVPVEHDATWTGERDESRYNKPFFEASNGARLPMIDCIFRLISTCNDENGYVCGMLCDKGSVGIILDGGGFENFFDGTIANNNSEITCRNGVLRSCGRYAAHARHISRISVRGADLSGAGQCAVYANRISMVDARSAWVSGSRNGLLAMNDSSINANDMVLEGLWGEYIAAAGNLSSVNGVNMTVNDYYGYGPCFQVRSGSEIALGGLTGNILNGSTPLYSQKVNTLTGEGILYLGTGEGYDDP